MDALLASPGSWRPAPRCREAGARSFGSSLADGSSSTAREADLEKGLARNEAGTLGAGHLALPERLIALRRAARRVGSRRGRREDDDCGDRSDEYDCEDG